ncbi:hypothetical protein C8R21_11062 [Nitrosospira multiformis]|jgi:hypothetical protein|uniref:Uncharacterized protein n=1 Tax=Nitrosospira multiformis TaxID=1231 RepID=A0A2T5IBX2_9PROT|nr:hypothetical protein [Nitrosospira multiformis]PTQ81329.1 hypothetical protein C8R21_11062 [Nitrosospira multiformis]
MSLAEVMLQPFLSLTSANVAEDDPLSSLTEFYQFDQDDQDRDEDESEIDLMIQLSGMVYSPKAGEE